MMSSCTSMVPPHTRSSRQALFGVLYAEDFDASDNAVAQASIPSLEPEHIEPLFTLAELEVAKAEARLAGQAATAQSLAGARNQLLQSLACAITIARDDGRAAAEAIAEGSARCMLSALNACLPALCERHGPGELQILIRNILPGLSHEPRITVRLHPDAVPLLQAEIATLDAELAERVHMLPTETVLPGDLRITWGDGLLVRDAGRAQAAIHAALTEMGLLPTEDTDA